MTLCNGMSGEPELNPAVIPALCGAAGEATPPVAVGERIAAFLDGTTHGEDLLHELYDHVLDEPVPPRMLALLDR